MTFPAMVISPDVMTSLLASSPCSALCTLLCGCGWADLKSLTTATVQPDWTAYSHSCIIKPIDKYFLGLVVNIINVPLKKKKPLVLFNLFELSLGCLTKLFKYG